MLEKYEEFMMYTDKDGDFLSIETGEAYALLFGFNDDGNQVGVGHSDVAEVIRSIVELANLNEDKDFVVPQKKAAEEVYVDTPTTFPITDGHMLSNEEIAKLIAPGDIFQNRDNPSTFARVVKVMGGTVVYVSSYNLFKEDFKEESGIVLPFARFISLFSMWRPAPAATTTGTVGPLIPARLAAAGYIKDKVEVTVFKPDVDPVTVSDVKLGDKLWVRNAAHEVIGNDEFSLKTSTYRRISFRNDSYPVIYRTAEATVQKVRNSN